MSHLQQLTSHITYYWQAKRTVPKSLEEMSESDTFGEAIPVDPETGEGYVYRATGPRSYTLCATFNAPSRPMLHLPDTRVSASLPVKGANENWDHEAGEVCFDRTIDPDFYPQFGG